MIDWLASVFVLLVAIQQMESVQPCATGISWRERCLALAEGVSWIVLGLGAFVTVIKPFAIPIPPSPLYDTLPIVGVAMVLLVAEYRNE
jgi:hypothetical protein